LNEVRKILKSSSEPREALAGFALVCSEFG